MANEDTDKQRGISWQQRGVSRHQRGLPNIPRLLKECYFLELDAVPATYDAFEARIIKWISGCVMSRTRSVHRERELVKGNPSLEALWKQLIPGKAARIVPTYTWGPYRIEGITFSSPQARSQPTVLPGTGPSSSIQRKPSIPRPKALRGPPALPRHRRRHSTLIARRLHHVLLGLEKRIAGLAGRTVPSRSYRPKSGTVTPFSANAFIDLSVLSSQTFGNRSYRFYLNENYYGFVLRYHDLAAGEIILERNNTLYVYPDTRFAQLFEQHPASHAPNFPRLLANGPLGLPLSSAVLGRGPRSLNDAWGKYYPGRLDRHEVEHIRRAILEIRLVPG